MNHHLTTTLRDSQHHVWGDKSQARFAKKNAPGGVVVFLHGFKGSAIRTWLEFPYLLGREPKAGNYDCLFYGYNTREQAGGSAAAFREFLRAVAEKPASEIVNPSLVSGVAPRPDTFRYQHIVIAAHSLGAVVARLALLQCEAPPGHPLPWMGSLRLALFAPAHSGALAVDLASMLLSGIPVVGGGPIEALARRRYRSINDLDPKRRTLPDMELAIRQRLQAGPPSLVGCHRAWVVHGSDEWVVTVNQFLEDKPFQRLANADHFQTCKPKFTDRRPLDFLLQVMP